jgi:polysaccharide export outer membrane protein
VFLFFFSFLLFVRKLSAKIRKKMYFCALHYYYTRKTVMKFRNTTLLVATVLLSSCGSTRNVAYFDDIDTHGIAAVETGNIRIRPDDQLTITVSALDAASVAPFNMPLVAQQSISDTRLNQTGMLQTYRVKSGGEIDFPTLGSVAVAGLTTQELEAQLKTKLSEYVEQPVVNVRIVNFKVDVVGEVKNPGAKTSTDERMTVMDALAMAGDMTIYGRRDNVLVIRDNGGRKEYGRLDLTSVDAMNSKYFYLQQNDVVYVEPNNSRKASSHLGEGFQHKATVASIVVSAVAAVSSIIVALLLK